MPEKVVIMGAAGKDFHVFNTCYRDNPDFQVIAFTATQIPNIENRSYPPSLAGRLYPDGIPIKPEQLLDKLITQHQIDEVVFAYSDISYDYLNAWQKKVANLGARFSLPESQHIMIKSTRPVIAVTAVRTGAGKSQTARRIVDILKSKGRKLVVVRHPMPYGDLTSQVVQRFETLADLDKYKCTIEEREDYEPHLERGVIVFAGVDYEKILRQAEAEVGPTGFVIWDGGNNDIPFFKPDLYITVADPLRPGHELSYYPGRVNFETADVIIINKVDTATPEATDSVISNARKHNPKAIIIQAKSPVLVPHQGAGIKGKKVLVVEDGPTVTHGGMKFGAGFLAAQKYKALEIIDPRPYAKGSINASYDKYPDIGPVLPALGYGQEQIKELEDTINAIPCDVALLATPTNLGRYLKINKPYLRITYELEELGQPNLEQVLERTFTIPE